MTNHVGQQREATPGDADRPRSARHGAGARPTSRLARRARSSRGAAAVELALVLPVLVMLLFGIVQFSIAFNQKQGLHAAAREGARYASLPTSTSADIRARVTSGLAGVVVSGTPTITITPAASQPCLDRQGQRVKVSVSTTEQVDIPLVFNRTITLTGIGEFRCE